jgi:hypothetical protein
MALLGGALVRDEPNTSTRPVTPAILPRLGKGLHGHGRDRRRVVHVHAVIAVEGDRSIGVHRHAAAVGTFFARAYVIPS